MLRFDKTDIVDLSHPYNKDTIYWPSSPDRFELKSEFKGHTDSGYFYSANKFCTPEHGGTHVDAPVHFSEHGWSVDKIPLDRLMGDAVVIDIRSQAEKDRDYRLKVSDIEEWEKRWGRIPDDALILLLTGWEKFWSDATAYLGDAKDVSKLHFPSFGEDAVQFLISHRKIKAIGVDTASIDFGQSKDFRVHQIACGSNVLGFENLMNLHLLPPIGSTVIGLPMKIEGGSGGPLRMIGLVPKK